MYKKILKFLFFVFVLGFFNIQTALAAPVAPYFQLVAAQGQGAGSDTFYQGRCFRVDMYLNTGGINANGADVEINYNSAILQAVQSNCSTAATVVYADGLFDAYPGQGNSITSNKIKLSAYNNPGVSTNVSNGLYGHLFFKVLSGVGDYTLGFQFTPGLTTDTNLAQTNGDGTDILAEVGDLALYLDVDTDNPTVNSKSPADLATGVAVNSTVSFSLYDAMAGVNSAASSVRMKAGSGSWFSQSVNFGTPLTTNQNRYYQYNSTVSPNSSIKTNGGYYQYNTTYTVEATVGDLGDPATHSQIVTWSFSTEDDTNAPYVDSRSPADNANGVNTSTNISFNIKDYKNNSGSIPGLGVNINSLAFVVSSLSAGSSNLTCSSSGVTCTSVSANNIAVTIDPTSNFAENELVTVRINASDLHSPANVMAQDVFSFTTADTAPPLLSSLSPAANSYGNVSSTNIGFHVTDIGSGVDLSSLQVLIGGILYTPSSPQMIVSGDASDYFITINPTNDFVNTQAVIVKISVRDQAATPNNIVPNPYEYNFIIGLGEAVNTTTTLYVTTTLNTTTTVENTCPVCPVTTCSGGGVIYIKEPQTCPVPAVCEKSGNTTSTITVIERIVEKQDCAGVTKEVIKNVFVSPSVSSPIQSGSDKTTTTIVGDTEVSTPDVSKETKFDRTAFLNKYRGIPWILVIIILLSFISEIFVNHLKVARMGYVVIMVTIVVYWMFADFGTNINFDSYWHKPILSTVEVSNVVEKTGEIVPEVKGSLSDVTTGKPLINYTLAVGDQSVVSDGEGKFLLLKVDSSSKIRITGKNITSPIYVDMAGRKNLNLKVDFGMYNFVNQLTQNFKQNKFKNLYNYVQPEIKENLSEEEFVNLNNKNLIAVNKKYSVKDIGFDYEIKVVKNWQSKQTKQKYPEVYEMNLIRHTQVDGSEVIIKEPVYILKTPAGNSLVI